mgnify:CR=1 FL=1
MSDQPSSDKKVIPIAVAAAPASVPESPTGATIRTLGLVSAIGLSVVMEFVQAHGGTIELVSEFGEGSTFTLVLPVEHTLVDEE